jgi:transcriptional regulator with XRE-family HTH domain
MADVSEILELIKIKRKEKGITQKEVANFIGVSEMTYIRIENGQSELKLSQYIDICKFLGVELVTTKESNKETALVTSKESDVSNIWQELCEQKNEIKKQNDKLDELLNIFKKGNKKK